jgi:D-alanyl-lipoteichoic acid acyltransferase DltB (MBOAT superfamily)
MTFNSISFLIFFALVLAIFYSFRSDYVRKVVLLISSHMFYAAWNPPFALLLVFSTVVDWQLATDCRRR